MNENLNNTMTRSKMLAPDRFLKACPIRYDCRRLFVYMIEMEHCEATQSIETILSYPEQRDKNFFADDAKLDEFIQNVKRFAFPYRKNLYSAKTQNSNANSSLVQFFTFVFTDINRIRQYGFCRSSQSGNHILCMISYLPWYNVFMNILNKVSTIINERETQSLYSFLEALYEYELPDPGNYAQIFSHDGLDQIRFQCPDRRILPSIQENRNLLKFFAFFDLEKLKKIFTALLLERSILVVSKDLENLTSCGLSFEYLIYPLEWLHTFVPIVPEHIDVHVFNQPFPFIYGVHTCIYDKLNQSQLDNCMIILVDERQIINGDRDRLPQNIDDYLTKKLDYFKQPESMSTGYGVSAPQYFSGSSGVSAASNESTTAVSTSANFHSVNKATSIGLLNTATIKSFLDSVLMVIDDYREYIVYDANADDFKLDEVAFFKLKNVLVESNTNGAAVFGASAAMSNKYQQCENEFYHELRITQAFEEFCRDRADYLKAEKVFYSLVPKTNSASRQFQKDFIETLYDQFKSEHSKFASKLNKNFKILKNKTNEFISNAKEKSTNIRSNFIKTRDQLIKKSNSIENDLKEKALNKQLQQKQLQQQADVDKAHESKQTPSTSNQYQSDNSYSASSASSRSSISTNEENIKEVIRRTAEESKLDESFNANLNRLTIDLSNDPDIKKYFELNNESDDDDHDDDHDDHHDQDTNRNLIKTDSDDQFNSLNSLANRNSNQTVSPQSANLIDIAAEVSHGTFPTLESENRSLSTTTPGGLGLSNTMMLNPLKPTTSSMDTGAANDLKSIINEFDPLNSHQSSSNPSIGTSSKPSVASNYHANLVNLTPRPFQMPNTTPQSSHFRPNYNINLPMSLTQPNGMNSAVRPIVNYNQPNMPMSQSLNAIARNANVASTAPQVNPFTPTPFYLNNNNTNVSQSYRPVQFNTAFMPQANGNFQFKPPLPGIPQQQHVLKPNQPTTDFNSDKNKNNFFN